MKILNYKELIKEQELDLNTMHYIINSIKDFQKKDEYFYDADNVFKDLFWGLYELFIVDDNGFKGCCITKLQLATNGSYYVEVICCIGEFKDNFIKYINALRDKIKDIYKNDKPAFYKIDGRLGWAKYFDKLDMLEMSRTYVGSFKYEE